MKIIRFWKPVLWLAVILFLSLIPGNRLPGVPKFPHFDKVAHIAMYFGLAILLLRPLRFVLKKPVVWTVIICLLIGIFVEYLQEFTALNRTGSWGDVIANLAGALLGVSFYHYLVRDYWWEKYI